MRFKSTKQFVNYLFEQVEPEATAEEPKEKKEDESPKEIVVKAIDRTPKESMERSLKQRTPGEGSAGSTFLQPQTAESLKDADWKPLTHSPENIRKDTIAFEADIPGKLGAADINDYPDDQPAVIQPSHLGKGIDRASGKLMAEVGAVLPDGLPTVDFTTIILGPKDKPNEMVVYTFHPGPPSPYGAPIFLEDMKKEFNTDEDKILTTIGKAKELGFITIKHVNSLPKMANVEKSEAEGEPKPLSESRMYQDFFGKQSGFDLNRWQKMAGIRKMLKENTEAAPVPQSYDELPDPIPENTYFMRLTTKFGYGYAYDFNGNAYGATYYGNGNITENYGDEDILERAKEDAKEELHYDHEPEHVYFMDDSYDPNEEYGSSKNNKYELINR